MTEDLLPCPFCGQAPRLHTEIITEPLDLTVYVTCEFCGSRGETMHLEIGNCTSASPENIVDELTTAADNAADSWNQRQSQVKE